MRIHAHDGSSVLPLHTKVSLILAPNSGRTHSRLMLQIHLPRLHCRFRDWINPLCSCSEYRNSHPGENGYWRGRRWLDGVHAHPHDRGHRSRESCQIHGSLRSSLRHFERCWTSPRWCLCRSCDVAMVRCFSTGTLSIPTSESSSGASGSTFLSGVLLSWQSSSSFARADLPQLLKAIREAGIKD